MNRILWPLAPFLFISIAVALFFWEIPTRSFLGMVVGPPVFPISPENLAVRNGTIDSAYAIDHPWFGSGRFGDSGPEGLRIRLVGEDSIVFFIPLFMEQTFEKGNYVKGKSDGGLDFFRPKEGQQIQIWIPTDQESGQDLYFMDEKYIPIVKAVLDGKDWFDLELTEHQWALVTSHNRILLFNFIAASFLVLLSVGSYFLYKINKLGWEGVKVELKASKKRMEDTKRRLSGNN